MGDNLDNEEALNEEMRKAMEEAAHSVQEDAIDDVAKFLWRHYTSFRRNGFGRVQSTVFTVMMFAKMLGNE